MDGCVCARTLARTGSNWTATGSFHGVFSLSTSSWLIFDSIQDGIDREREPQLKNAQVSLMTREGGRNCKLLAKIHLHVRDFEGEVPSNGEDNVCRGVYHQGLTRKTETTTHLYTVGNLL